SQRCVLSKAPVPSALLKTRKSVVKYSHNGWTKEWGQTKGISGCTLVVGANGRKWGHFEGIRSLVCRFCLWQFCMPFFVLFRLKVQCTRTHHKMVKPASKIHTSGCCADK
ncbi:MAG: hypothetical protein ACYSTT_19115, partial [Planctomycetota bacterium]